MKIDKRNPHHWLLLLQQSLYTLVAICARYVTRKPTKRLVVLYGHQLSGNLKALYDEWQLTRTEDFDCYFLSLDAQYSQKLRAEGVNVLQCSKLRDMLRVGRCDAIITDHGLHAMGPLVRLTNILFIDVWHGIPFKGFTEETFRVQHRYNEVWVSSPLLKTIYQDKFGFNPQIVRDLGYARADKLFLNKAPDSPIRDRVSIPPDNKIVLYAPTWQQEDKDRELFPFDESQDSFIQLISDTCNKHSATLIIRSHLNAKIGKQMYDNVVYCSQKNFPDSEGLLREADILICDWSSIAFDYLALNRPTIFLDVEPPFKNGFSLGKEYRFGKVASDMKALEVILDGVLEKPEAYSSEQGEVHNAIAGKVYGNNRDGLAASRQLDRLDSLMRPSEG
ncbi:MAG: CDP-glycerol--glycerophosphate glycerophosphotransferase [Gammaproteobacteria bacterium]|nr:MAG: CDP-glycerol--glycerophosphate glycerophosphotransferase [Gammaproteobacteria bacterium]